MKEEERRKENEETRDKLTYGLWLDGRASCCWRGKERAAEREENGVLLEREEKKWCRKKRCCWRQNKKKSSGLYWFGATPCCHGAERIVGQYKFGRMSGWCVAFLGVAKLILGLVNYLVKILDQFLVGVLGVLLSFVGIELAMCSMNMNFKKESVVMLIARCFICWLKCST
ncbi:Sulfate transporter [Forsythia ovata]|uniref:Sulfate transporter n=1 Tax=Forsythia ovata TaxID=205694 RepID=A0ABD1WMA7_9LAMI